MKKYHKKLGEIEILNSDEVITLVRTASGEEKKLMTKYMELSDTPFAESKKTISSPIFFENRKPISKKQREQLAITANTPADWMNADGTKNWDKYNDFLEERAQAARNSVKL